MDNERATPTTVQTEPPRVIRPDASAATTTPRYTIGSLVSNRRLYDNMLVSFRDHGFGTADCEYLFIDNSGPEQTGAYRGLNAILNAARAPIVILCHQDVRLIGDDRAILDRCIAQLASADPSWAVAGNAGGVAPGRLALRITDPHGKDQKVGTFPQRVMSLDENFIVVRRDARIGFSHDLEGFHFYGADICLNAAIAGYSAYVIDFHLEHLSPGRKAKDFHAAERAFRAKWSAALKPRWVQTTCSLVHISGGAIRSGIGAVLDPAMARIIRRRPGARGFKKPVPETA